MDICRLCLQQGSQNIPNTEEILDILKKFLPSMNPCLKQSVFQLCETCLCNINTLKKLSNILNKTNEKLEIRINNSNVDKLDLIQLLATKQGPEMKRTNICRICLQMVDCPQVFLYENESNILRYDLISKMFAFCNLILDCDKFKQPVMCLQCWENIQVCYSFKKNYVETAQKIKTYLTQFKIPKYAIDEEVLKNMSKYFSSEINDLTINNVGFNDDYEDIKGYYLRKNKKKELFYRMSRTRRIKENNSTTKKTEYNDVAIPRRTKYNFTTEDDELLLEFYYKVVNGKPKSSTRPWKSVQEKWLNKFPNNPLKVSTIHNRLTTLLTQKNKNVSRNELAIDKLVNNEGVHNTLIDKVVSVSLLSDLKSEPLSDEEIDITENFTDVPPSGTESDLESPPLPLLERMDSPEDFSVDHYSTHSKRDTSYEYSSNCHIKKSMKCTKCNFDTNKKFLLQQCLSGHYEEKEDEELPVLIPFTITY